MGKVDVRIFVKCVRTFLKRSGDAPKAFRFRNAKTAIENANETQKKRKPHPSQKTVLALERIAKALDIHELSKKKNNGEDGEKMKTKKRKSLLDDEKKMKKKKVTSSFK